jgi:hypothetical protein
MTSMVSELTSLGHTSTVSWADDHQSVDQSDSRVMKLCHMLRAEEQRGVLTSIASPDQFPSTGSLGKTRSPSKVSSGGCVFNV